MPSFAGAEDFSHEKQTRTGVILVNLGTPDNPSVKAVRRYLDEFLSDPRVVEFPRLLWWLVMQFFILRFRPTKVAKAYKTVWRQDGSPLLVFSQMQADTLKSELESLYPGCYEVFLAMRYGKPSIHDVLETCRKAQCRKLIILPMFPQYSATTTASVFDEVAKVLKSWRLLPTLRMPMNYHDRPTYIDALATSIEASWKKQGKGQQLLMSFHGLPQRYHRAGDPYYCECMKTARLLAARLGLDDAEWQALFQSRFGKEPWLQPYLDETLALLPASGIKSVDVVCPGFAADCLETLEEVAEHNRELFMNAGGERYQYIPALNNQPEHIKMLLDIVHEESQGWLSAVKQYNFVEQGQERRRRASEQGAKI